MTPPFLAVLPAIMPDLARRCIQSMAPELRANLLLVDNTTTGEIADEHAGQVMFVVKELKNAGVSHAWNDGLAMATAQAADWCLLVSQSMEFGARGGLDLLDASDRERHIIHSQYGWHALAMHHRVWSLVGRFDPVFPAYGNEIDYLRRMHLAGLPSPTENGGELEQVNINASCLPPAACLRSGVVKIRYADHLEALERKWGGPKGAELWTSPYDDPRLDWTFTGEYRGAKV